MAQTECNLQEILSLCRYRGSFKPPQSLAREDGFFSGRDFYQFDNTMPFSTGTRAEDLYDRESNENAGENVIVVEGSSYDTRPFASGLVRHFRPDYGIERVLSLAIIPGAYAQRQDFSVDHRKNLHGKTVGTAQVALDFLVPKEQFPAVMETLRRDPARLVKTLRGLQLTSQGRNVDVYKHFFLDGENSYTLTIK